MYPVRHRLADLSRTREILMYPGMRTKNEEFRGIFVLRPLLSILQPLKVAVKCLIMVVEQKFKVLRKAEKEIY